MNDAELLDFHRRLVEIPSLSHEEAPIADFVEGFLKGKGLEVERVGDNVLARVGSGPRLLLNSHYDTVPVAAGWTRDPHKVQVEDGRIFGLGSNDAKGPLAAMTAAALRAQAANLPLELMLLFVADEETGGAGTELVWPMLREEGLLPGGVVVGEPTGLDIAVAQKGMLVLELVAEGDACHAAHARRLGARNPIWTLAKDLMALEDLDLGDPHPALGPVTLTPTVISGGSGRNQVQSEMRCVLDLRTVPGIDHAELAQRVRDRVSSHVELRSGRLKPTHCDDSALVLSAARQAAPQATLFGSPTMSDMVFFDGVPAIKVGPGKTERSHTADEYILQSEVLEGAKFYLGLASAYAELASNEGSADVSTVG